MDVGKFARNSETHCGLIGSHSCTLVRFHTTTYILHEQSVLFFSNPNCKYFDYNVFEMHDKLISYIISIYRCFSLIWIMDKS